jgi:hypothetical protein
LSALRFFILPLLTSLIFTAVARRELRHGRVEPLGWTWSPKSVLRRLPKGTLRRGTALGALCLAALGPPAVAVIVAFGVGDLSIGEFVTYKAIFGVVLGIVVTPIVGLWALSEAEPAEPCWPLSKRLAGNGASGTAGGSAPSAPGGASPASSVAHVLTE